MGRSADLIGLQLCGQKKQTKKKDFENIYLQRKCWIYILQDIVSVTYLLHMSECGLVFLCFISLE